MLALATATAAFVQPSMLPVVTRARTVHQPQVAMLANGQKQALVTAVAAMALVFNPMSAEAGRSGGRVGGRAPAPRAPTVSRPAMAPRTTNVYVAPSPMGMGMGYGGYGMGYGGYGMGGGNGVGLYLGLSVAEAFLREQQRQAYLQQQLKTQQQLGADQAAIQQLQQELAMQNAKVEALKSQGGSTNTAPVSQETEEILKLKLQLLEQQKEMQALKAAQ